MQKIKIVGLTVAALATVGASASFAAPIRHGRPHQVCKIVKSHGHAKKVCRWVK